MKYQDHFLIIPANLTICQNKLDLGFLLDSSGSVGYNHFKQMKSFVKDLTDYYKLGPEETRVSVMSFSNSAYIHISFSGYFSDKNEFDAAVDRISYTGEGTATAIALNITYNHMFTLLNRRRGEGKNVIMWTLISDIQLGMSYKIYALFWELTFCIPRDQKSFGDLDGW